MRYMRESEYLHYLRQIILRGLQQQQREAAQAGKLELTINQLGMSPI